MNVHFMQLRSVCFFCDKMSGKNISPPQILDPLVKEKDDILFVLKVFYLYASFILAPIRSKCFDNRFYSF